MPTYQDVSPTGHIDPSGDWINANRVYDGDWINTYASNNQFPISESDGNWTNWLILTFAALMYLDKIRFKYWTKDIHIQILNNATGQWDDVIKRERLGQHTVFIPTTYSDRVRVRGSETEKEFWFFELNAERVIPDAPTPPPPPNPQQVYQTVKEETGGQPTYGTARIRTLHRTTIIAPWIV